MAAGMALASANVTPDVDTFTDTSLAVGGEKVSVIVRRNRMRVMSGDSMVLERDDVRLVERVSARQWRVTTVDGVYEVERLRGATCCARGGV